MRIGMLIMIAMGRSG